MADKQRRPVKEPQKGSTYKPLVPAVDQASKVLIYLAKSHRFKVSLTEICKDMGIHKSKGFSILHTLQQYGFVEKDPESKNYSLGPGLLPLSRRVLDNLDLRDIVTPFLESLARETNSTALLGLVSEGQVFVIAKKEGNSSVGVTISIGHRFHLTAGAHGKAIVAFMPDPERKKILGGNNLYFYGESAKTNTKRLKGELHRCRQTGFAKDLGGLLPGINAISSPVFGPNGKIVASIILIGTFAGRLIEQYGQRVAQTARNISTKLGNSSEDIFLNKERNDD